jgi:hypothetical protein
MSSLLNESVGSQASSTSALLPNKTKLKKQNQFTDSQKPTPLQQRKIDALDMAELIYNIYNSNCPISLAEQRKGKKNV